MDFQQTILFVVCLSLLTSSFSVHANLLKPRRFGDITPYSEETIADVSSLDSASSPKSAPTPPSHQSIYTSKTPSLTEEEFPAVPSSTEEEVSEASHSKSTPSKEEGTAPSPPADEISFSTLLSTSSLEDKTAGTDASLVEEPADSIVTSGLRSSDAGDKLLSTATDDAVSAVRAAAAAAGAGSVDPKALKFCAITEKPDVCINSVLPFVRSASAGEVDPMTILENEIKAGIKEAKKTINRLAVMASNHNIADQMKTCKENYKNALDSFKDALEAVSVRDLGRITSVLSGAITQIGTCDDAFAENPSLHSPLGPHFAARLKDLTDICLEIVNKWVSDH